MLVMAISLRSRERATCPAKASAIISGASVFTSNIWRHRTGSKVPRSCAFEPRSPPIPALQIRMSIASPSSLRASAFTAS